jgi:dihydrofolate reductase
VVSKSLRTVEHDVISDDVVEELAISITGSATLARSLLREGLVDELRLLVFPSSSAPEATCSTTGLVSWR